MAFFQHKEQMNNNGEGLSPKEQFISSMETKISLPSPDDQKKLTTYLAEQAKISNHIAQPISLPLTDEAKARLAQIDATDRDNQRAELTNLNIQGDMQTMILRLRTEIGKFPDTISYADVIACNIKKKTDTRRGEQTESVMTKEIKIGSIMIPSCGI